ncbi:MAG: sugar transferase [Erysipelotrichaceae bacterium]|nr:sugar transferase [Erysipelotrichaceae bacterium]
MNKNYDNKNNAKIVLGLINIILYVLFFAVDLIVFYDHINYYANGYALFMLIYTFFLIVFGRLFGMYELGDSTVTDLVLSSTITFLFSDVIVYLILCLIAFSMLAIWPVLILFVVETIIATLLVFYENKFIRDSYPVEYAIAIVGENHYKILDKINKYRDITVDVKKKYDVENIDFDNLDPILENVERVITVDIDHEQKKRVFKKCYEKGIRIFDVPSITDMLMASSSIIHLIDTPIVKINKFGPSSFEMIAKRTIDIVGSLILIIITSPVMLGVAIAIKLNDHGDVFFKQNRLTKDGKEFKILKFRSMVMNAEEKTGVVLAKQDDDRITSVGKFIRKTRFDELPQLLNILKGDMSFVGPRPERPEIYNEIIKDMPEFSYRLVVKAGLTGYAQIYGKYNTAMRDKLLLDLYYIENYSLIDDIKLLLMTFKIVFVAESTEGVEDEETNK